MTNYKDIITSKNYSDGTKHSDSVQKLLEILPSSHRKFIKIDEPVRHTFSNVLKQILKYAETETDLKLSVDEISKEKAKIGTSEINNVSEKKSNEEKSKGTSHNSNQVANINDNSDKNKLSKNDSKDSDRFDKRNYECYYCGIKGHLKYECKKRKWEMQNNYQGGIKNANERYNPRYSRGGNSRGSYRGSRGGRGRGYNNYQYNNQQSNYQNYNQGHSQSNYKEFNQLLKDKCQGYVYDGNSQGNSQSYQNRNDQGARPKNCYNCGGEWHIAKFCHKPRQN